MKPPAVSGVHSCHGPWTGALSSGVPEVTWLNLMRRIFGKLAALMSSTEPRQPRRFISMLDCPEQTQRSPTRMFLRVMLLRPLTVSLRFSPSLSGGSDSDHWPRASALVDAFWPASEALTSSPASAQPHTRTGWSRCTIMLSEKVLGSWTSAFAGSAPARSAAARSHWRSCGRGRCVA